MFLRKHKPQSEAEIIEQARKYLNHLERWGRWYSAVSCFYCCLFVGILAFTAWLVSEVIGGLVQAGQRPGFTLGFVLGSTFAFGLAKMAFHTLQFWECTLPDPRARLLAQYHDALAEIIAQAALPADEPSPLATRVAA